MRKSSILVSVVFATFMALTLSGCLTAAANGGTVSVTNSTVTVKMYVNAPDDLNAKAAELALQTANPNYQGVTSFSYKGTPTISNAGPVVTYVGYCESIRLALNTAYGNCKLTFNTQADGKGTVLDFSNTSVTVTSLLTMAVYGYTTVYAIYTYKSANAK